MDRRFWLSVIIAVLGLVILLKLGFWQLSRIPEKETEIQKIEAFFEQEPIELPMVPDSESQEYLPVVVRGEILDGEINVLVSTRSQGAGFRIIAPFRLEDGRDVLLDRGFIRSEDKDKKRNLGAGEVIGNLHWPDERGPSIPDDDIALNEWYARDVGKMAKHLGTEPILIVAKTTTSDQILPLPVSSDNIPNNHLAYAIQWFLFAGIWFGMTSVLLWRIRSANRQKSDEK